MRRFVPVAIALTIAGTASATSLAPDVAVNVNPPEAGKGSELNVDVNSRPQKSGSVRGVVVRLVRGFKFNPAAVGTHCRVVEASQTNACPAGSRIGGGEAQVVLTPGGQVTAPIDLYLAPRQHARDAAGIVAIADVEGRKGHAVGRVQRLDPDVFETYGLQIAIDPLQSAFRPPAGGKARIKSLNLLAGAHRTVDGRRRDLIRNPSCGADDWPWELLRIHQQGDRSHHYGSIECAPKPTP
ncbi:MAG TPA: hypothetical protein VJT75_01330 [Thermoleophilaceae bacterium]|nr:hypothetical protein [Thermoleophilaceae bacterium]